MSQENVEIVRASYEAVNRGDNDAAYSFAHPEIVFHTYTRSPEAGVYRGKDEVRKYNEDLFGQFESLRVEVEELVDAGDRVVVVSTQHAIPKGGGQQEIHVHMAEVWTVRDGLLAERHSYSSKGEALEAVGLRE
jgi:ketosteroid isomerase-like protein